jgi:fumarate hydratase subunit beta
VRKNNNTKNTRFYLPCEAFFSPPLHVHSLQLTFLMQYCKTTGDLTRAPLNTPVMLAGTLLTFRDGTLKQYYNDSSRDESILRDSVIYFCGPTPPRPGATIGSAGPTTASRMEPYFNQLILSGVTALIGKGPISDSAKINLQQASVPYFSAIGGTGALLNRTVAESELILYEDLGAEAVYRLSIDNFPVVRLG